MPQATDNDRKCSILVPGLAARGTVHSATGSGVVRFWAELRFIFGPSLVCHIRKWRRIAILALIFIIQREIRIIINQVEETAEMKWEYNKASVWTTSLTKYHTKMLFQRGSTTQVKALLQTNACLAWVYGYVLLLVHLILITRDEINILRLSRDAM